MRKQQTGPQVIRTKKLLAPIAFVAGIFALAGGAQAECGPVSIAEMNWGSAAIAAHVDRIILEAGYGCDAELVPGDTLPTFTSMDEKGTPDIAPELWINSMRAPVEKAVAENRLVVGAEILADGAIEGWWMPKFVADAHPDIKTVQQALEHSELFPAPGEVAADASASDKPNGIVTGCPAAWGCHIPTVNLFRALGAAEKDFKLMEPASAEELKRSIADAFESKTGWLGYYWAPTSLLARYQMVKLSFGVQHDKADWDNCTSIANCSNPKVNSYPTSRAFTIVTREFADKAGGGADYVKKRQWTNSTVNSLLAWRDDNQASNADAAKHFLKTMPEIWTNWVSPDAARKIEASLR